MNRRSFLAALGLAVPAIAAPKRVYSFLWDNPLVENAYEFRLGAYPQLFFSSPEIIPLNPRDYDKLVRELGEPQTELQWFQDEQSRLFEARRDHWERFMVDAAAKLLEADRSRTVLKVP